VLKNGKLDLGVNNDMAEMFESLIAHVNVVIPFWLLSALLCIFSLTLRYFRKALPSWLDSVEDVAAEMRSCRLEVETLEKFKLEPRLKARLKVVQKGLDSLKTAQEPKPSRKTPQSKTQASDLAFINDKLSHIEMRLNELASLVQHSKQNPSISQRLLDLVINTSAVFSIAAFVMQILQWRGII
jgi:hypothetical protein